jgi:hypothetical protein
MMSFHLLVANRAGLTTPRALTNVARDIQCMALA